MSLFFEDREVLPAHTDAAMHGKHKHITWGYEEKNMHQIFLLFTTTEKGLIKSWLRIGRNWATAY